MQIWDDSGIHDIAGGPGRWWEKEPPVIHWGMVEFIAKRQARLEREFQPGDYVRSSKHVDLLKVVKARLLVRKALVYDDEKWLQCVDRAGRLHLVSVKNVSNHLRKIDAGGQVKLAEVEPLRMAVG